MGHGKNAPSGVIQLGVGFKVPTGTLLGIPLDFTWNTLGDTPIWLGGSFGAYLGFLYLLLVIIEGVEFLYFYY